MRLFFQCPPDGQSHPVRGGAGESHPRQSLSVVVVPQSQEDLREQGRRADAVVQGRGRRQGNDGFIQALQLDVALAQQFE